MQGIDPKVIVHKLNIDPNFWLIKQKKRLFNLDRYEAINVEVKKLLKARLIKEVFYLCWLMNVMILKMNNGQWRVCIDFTELNKAYLEDNFPLPRFNQLVDSMAGNDLYRFCD